MSEYTFTVIGLDMGPGKLAIAAVIDGTVSRMPWADPMGYVPWSYTGKGSNHATVVKQAYAAHDEWHSLRGPIGSTGSVSVMAARSWSPETLMAEAPARKAPWWAPWRR